jgi:hypothetical protein
VDTGHGVLLQAPEAAGAVLAVRTGRMNVRRRVGVGDPGPLQRLRTSPTIRRAAS